MLIIADSSALVALATCNALYLLDILFENVRVPQKVFEECVIENKPQSKSLADYLQNKIITTTQHLPLINNLGQGEMEAMALYFEMQADYLLIDDNKARKIAELNQIKIIGSLGILLIAKNKGLIDKITPFLEIIANSLLYISPQLLAQIKSMANE